MDSSCWNYLTWKKPKDVSKSNFEILAIKAITMKKNAIYDVKW